MEWTLSAIDTFWTNVTFQETWIAVGYRVWGLCTAHPFLLAVEGICK